MTAILLESQGMPTITGFDFPSLQESDLKAEMKNRLRFFTNLVRLLSRNFLVYSEIAIFFIALSCAMKNLNKNIGELSVIIKSFSGSLNYLVEKQKELSKKQEIIETDRIYEKYGEPLEKEHKGMFACITLDGEYTLGKWTIDAVKKAEEEGLDDFILFQIGNPGGGLDV